MLTAKTQGALRLRTVSLEERSRLRSVNGTSAGKSLEAIEPKNFHPDVKNKYPLPPELHYIYQKQKIMTIIEIFSKVLNLSHRNRSHQMKNQ